MIIPGASKSFPSLMLPLKHSSNSRTWFQVYSQDTLLQYCRRSSNQVLEVAELALGRFSNLAGVGIIPRPRRNDSRRLSQLQDYANSYLFRGEYNARLCKYLGAALKESKRIFDFDNF